METTMVKLKNNIDAWQRIQAVNAKNKRKGIAQAIMSRAQMLAPVDTGALKQSVRLVDNGDTTSVVFGGDDVPYAKRRHYENKKNPQTLNYLEKAGESVKKQIDFKGGLR